MLLARTSPCRKGSQSQSQIQTRYIPICSMGELSSFKLALALPKRKLQIPQICPRHIYGTISLPERPGPNPACTLAGAKLLLVLTHRKEADALPIAEEEHYARIGLAVFNPCCSIYLEMHPVKVVFRSLPIPSLLCETLSPPALSSLFAFS